MRLQSSTETNESDIMQMVKYAMIATVMMVGGLFLTGCGGYVTREYTVRNEAQLREAFANVKANEVINITLESDIQLHGGGLQVPVGSTIRLDTPSNFWGTSREHLITKVYGEERHFYVQYQATLSIIGNVTIQSQQSASDASEPAVNRGGITVNGGTFNISGIVNIRNNRWSEGGGVSVENGGRFGVSGNANIGGNIASGNGGGVFVQANSNFSISGRSAISNNMAGNNGGGVFVQINSNFSISGSCTVSDNVASNIGGGIFANGQEVSISVVGSSSITRNTANNGGGVALLNGAQFRRIGSASVSNNTGGDVVEIDDDSNLPINNEPNIIETPQTEPQPQPSGGNQRQ